MTIYRQLAIESQKDLDAVLPKLAGIRELLTLLAENADIAEHQLTTSQAGSLGVINDSLANVIASLQEAHAKLSQATLVQPQPDN